MQQPITYDIDQQTAWRWLIALTAIALVARIINLNAGLWFDEYSSVVNQFRLPATELLVTFVGDNQHPLYALLTSISVSLFGEHNWVYRLPAMLFGVATIPALYWLGTQVARRKEALLAAALLALSYHHVWFSQNARGYTALALSAVLCSVYILRLFRAGNKNDVMMYALVAALGVYAHLTMVFVVVGHFLVYVLLVLLPTKNNLRSNWRYPLVAFFASGFLTLVFYGPIITQVIDYFANKPSMSDLSTPSWAIKEAIANLSIGFGAGIVVLGGVVMMAVGFFSYLRTNPVALGIFTLPIFITILGATLARGTMYPRFFFALVGMGVLIGVRGVMVTTAWVSELVFRGEKRKQIADRLAVAVMVAVIAVSTLSLLRNYKYPKMDYDGAIAYIKNNATENDIMLSVGSASWPLRHYYELSWPLTDTAAALNKQEQLAKSRGGRVWLVYAFERYVEVSSPEVLAEMKKRCEQLKEFKGTVGDGSVYVCRLTDEK